MAKVSKRYAEAVKLVDRSKTYSIEEAVKLAIQGKKEEFNRYTNLKEWLRQLPTTSRGGGL